MSSPTAGHSSLPFPVVVIGAGASGLTSIKACLEENLKVMCFEKTNHIGGLWHYREEVVEGVASVMKSTIINTSKEMTSFSDFPPPDHFPNFMHNTYLAQYLKMYADRFDLFRHVQLSHEVVDVKPDTVGQWLVTVHSQESGQREAHRASAIMVCTGHHSYPNRPFFKGLDRFQGPVMHSHAYRHIQGYSDKNVLVIGIGNSGGDLAVELSHVAAKVYLSTRRGSWIMPRLGDYGQPIDIQYGRRYVIHMLNLMPDFIKNAHAAFKLNGRYDHSMLNLRPEHAFYSQHPTVNDELPNRLLSGAVVIKGDVDHFTADGVVFEGEPGGVVHAVDAVFLATGYDIQFPFFDSDVVAVEGNRVPLYRHVFPPLHPTLAFVGLVQPFGPLPPICELQARWAVQVFLGQCHLPPTDVMKRHIVETHERHDRRYVHSRRHTIEVDGIPYMDEIATQFGAKPRMAHLCLHDWSMFCACFFGPCVPYQFRLNGPHAWPDAREAILGVRKRVLTPLNTRFSQDLKKSLRDPMLSLHGLAASFLLMAFFLLMSTPLL